MTVFEQNATFDYTALADAVSAALDRAERRRPVVQASGCLPALIVSQSDGRITIGDILVTSAIGGAFVLAGGVAAFGGVLQGAPGVNNWALWGSFLRAGAFVVAGKFALDALDLQGWWAVTLGELLRWYDKRHPAKGERPIVVNTRQMARTDIAQDTDSILLSTAPVVQSTELTCILPNGVRISVQKLAQFLRAAVESGTWARDYWCNTAANKTAPGIGFLTKSRWEGIRALCDTFTDSQIWGTTKLSDVEYVIDTIASEVRYEG